MGAFGSMPQEQKALLLLAQDLLSLICMIWTLNLGLLAGA